MSKHPLPIHLGEPMQNLGTSQAVGSRLPFQETIDHLKGAIEAEDLWLIHEIDPQMFLQRAGFSSLGLRQLLFFHPRYLVRLLEGNPGALVEVPLKLVILEMPDGKVTVRRPEPLVSIGCYPGMGALAAELDGICMRLISTISVPPGWKG